MKINCESGTVYIDYRLFIIKYDALNTFEGYFEYQYSNCVNFRNIQHKVLLFKHTKNIDRLTMAIKY